MINKSDYKFVLQKKDYDCGVAAVATILLNARYKSVNYEKLSKDLKLSKNGVPEKQIVKYFFKRRKLNPKFSIDTSLSELKKEIKNKRITLILYQGWGNTKEIKNLECGHYAVVAGYEGKAIYLLDPSVYQDWGDGIGWRKINEINFKKRWIDMEKNKKYVGWMLSIKRNVS